MPHALIIEDDAAIAEIVREKLESMDHTCDSAASQAEAEEFLVRCAYDYILLDLAIPMKFNSKPDKQYGRNLLVKIKGTLGHAATPVIVMTANDISTYHVCAEVMKDGASDFVGKPFGDDHPLEKKIRELLLKHPPREVGAVQEVRAANLRPFQGAMLDFYDDRVELNGQKIAGAKGSTQMRKVLDCLHEKQRTGSKTNLTGASIAENLKFHRGEHATTDAVRQIREVATRILREKDHVRAEGNDIVANADKGYVLGHQIRTRTGGADPSEQPDLRFTAMQKSILRELRKDGSVARGLLGKRLSLHLAKLDEEVVSLERDGFVARDGNGKARRLKLVNDPLLLARATDGAALPPGKTGSVAPI